MTRFWHSERERTLARKAYQSFEPYHLVAYFGPHIEAARERLGLNWPSAYTGMRAAPLGEVPSSVVAATFFGFKPSMIDKAWSAALDKHSIADLNAARTAAVDEGLRGALGDVADSEELAKYADRLREIISTANFGARPLAAAYAALPWPDAPHLSLWQSATLWREWRGDGHNAALISAGLTPIDALVLYDAGLAGLSPAQAAGRGRDTLQPTRRWTDEDWETSAASLQARGLLDGNALTSEGAAVRQSVEDATDDAAASVWVGVDDADEVLAGFRPYAKLVINSGYFPGTSKK